MKLAGAVLKAILSLFVDDGSLAVCILAGLAAAWLLFERLPLSGVWHGGLLFAGIATILAENVVRTTRRRR